jgi:hypothetical protein
MLLVAALALLAGMYPWASPAGPRTLAFLAMAALIALPLAYWRHFAWGPWLAAIAAAVLLLGPVLFEGSYAWARVGYIGPTDNHRGMHMGLTYNLAAILRADYHFDVDTEVAWAGMTIQQLSRVSYAVLLVLAGAGLAMHSALRSRATLVALAAPWLIMFAVLMQMHERYLTYAAAISAILAGYGVGFTLLHGLITVLAVALLHHPDVNAARWPGMHEIIHGMYPGAGWAVLLLAGVFMWVILRPPALRGD